MAAGPIWRRSYRVSCSIWRCPCVVRFSTKSGMPPARRTGPRNVLALQIVISAFCTAGSYRGGRCWCRCFARPPTRMVSLRGYRCSFVIRRTTSILSSFTYIIDESMRGLCEFRFSATLLRESEPVGWRNLALRVVQRLMPSRQRHGGEGEGG